MVVTRRAALRSLAATTVGAITGAAVYGVAYERHHLGTTHATLPVSGLAPALDGLRIGFLTDVHHSAMVPAEDIRSAVDMLAASRPDYLAAITLRGVTAPMSARLRNCSHRSPHRMASSPSSAITTTTATCPRRSRQNTLRF